MKKRILSKTVLSSFVCLGMLVNVSPVALPTAIQQVHAEVHTGTTNNGAIK